MSRPLIAQVNLSALRENLAKARERAAGAQVLAVVHLDTAITLRERHYARRILLVEGFCEASELAEISARRLAVVVHHMEQVKMLEAATLSRPIEVFIKVNTGMNRLGFRISDVHAIVERLSHTASVAVMRLMTHLARADEEDGLREQLDAFEDACRGLPYPRSLANSAGVIRYADVGGEYVRPGIMLYGSSPFPYDTAEQLGLTPVMTLKSALIGVQDLKPNQSVGYGGTYTAARAHRIGVIACGYADGYPRHAPNGTPVLVCGKKARTAGRVSMDLMTVDLTDVPEATIGSPVVLWGEGLSVDDVASAASTVGYQLLCSVSARVPFVTTEVGTVDIEL